MARRKQNPINDIINTAGAWLGGSRGPSVNPQVSRVTGELTRAASAADAATGGFGAAAVRDVRAFAQGGSLPTNLAKTAAVNLAAAAAGVGASKVAGKAVGKVVESGRVVNPVAAARNLAKGEKVVVHGTSAKIKGSELVPKSGSPGSKTIGQPVVFAHDPRAVGASTSLYQESISYANKNAEYGNYGQIVIGSAKKKDLKRLSNVLDVSGPGSVVPDNPVTRKYLYSEQPIKIQKVIEPVQRTYPGTSRQYTTFDPKILQRELRKQGVSLRGPSIAEQIDDVRKAAAIKIQQMKNRRRFKDDSDF